MNLEELSELRNSNEAPFNHQNYTVWLHNKIIERIEHELWQHIESVKDDPKNCNFCNQVLKFNSLQKINLAI